MPYSAPGPFLGAQTASAYQVSRSLRFRSSASAYLNRTFGTPTNNNVWTYSAWVKRGSVSASNSPLFAVYTDGNNYTVLSFDGNQQLSFNIVTSGVARANSVTNNVFRDPSAWYHVLLVANRGEATDSNRIKMYINGSQVTSWSTTPTWNNSYSSLINASGNVHLIGNRSTSYFDGYMAEVNFIDGQALTPSSFGAFDTNGIWQPIACTVSDYGKNGFYLPFSDSANIFNDKAAIATNHSAANNWTASGLQTSSSTLTTYDYLLDSPTNYADGGNGRGNYAVWNSLSNAATYADANLSVTTTNNSAPYNAETTIKTPSSGKWYAEITLSAKGAGNPAIGIGNNNPDQFACYRVNGTYVTGSMGASSTGTPATFTTNDIIGVAFDADNGTLNFYKNGSLQTGGFTGITAGNYSFILREDSTSGDGAILNCGQRPFTYSNYGTDRPAATFLALNTQNLPTPTIAAGNKYFDATTYTGNGTSQSITNNGSFQPDLVWIKPRVAAGTSHVLTDAVRGVSKFLSSNGTSAESSVPGFQLTAFNSNGFTLVDNANGDYGVNGASGGTYSGTPPNFIAWQWNAGGAPTTDNVAGAGNVPTAGSVKINGANSTSALAGSIAATRLSANPSAGFSVVTWTGNGTTGTVGHGLGVAPSLIIMKRRDTGGTGSNWVVYSASAPLDFTTYPEWLYLNATNAFQTSASSANYPWSQRPSSTLFYMNTGTSEATNVNNATYVAYCFAPVAGYSAFGSYTGNGSADGPMIFTNMRSRFILIKRTDAAANDWIIYDTSRNTYNATINRLFPNLSDAEGTASGGDIDVLSNGFKIRSTYANVNASGGTYIWAAFSENPFKYSRAR